MKWKVIKKGNTYKRRPELEAEDWVCLITLMLVASLLLLGTILRRL